MKSDIFVQFENIDSWEKFCKDITTIQKRLRYPYFRGQGHDHCEINCSKTGWELQPSLYRIDGNSHPRFISWLKTRFIVECKDQIRSIFGRELDINTESDEKQKNREILMALLQHLEFPTPLLDWTKDPFNAVYFAFEGMDKDAEMVTIFLIDQHSWKTNANGSESLELRTLELKDIIPIIPRQSAQKSVYTYFRGGGNVYNQIIADENHDEEREEFFIACCKIRASEKNIVVKDLRGMGITRESLYPDENDSMVVALRNKIPLLRRQYIECISNNRTT